MISTTRTLMADSARARSLDRLLIWLTLTPGAGRSSKRVITGPGLHRHHLGLDAEIAQLDFHQARHGLQRLVGIGLLARARLVQQRQRRQLARLRRIEQRHLALALDALALLRHGRRRPRCAAAAGWPLSSALRAPPPGAPACAAAPRPVRAAARVARAVHSIAFKTQAPSLSMISNQDTPKNSATPASHRPSSNKVAPRKLKPCGAAAARQHAEHAAGAVRQSRAAPMQRRQAAAGRAASARSPRRAARC